MLTTVATQGRRLMDEIVLESDFQIDAQALRFEASGLGGKGWVGRHGGFASLESVSWYSLFIVIRDGGLLVIFVARLDWRKLTIL